MTSATDNYITDNLIQDGVWAFYLDKNSNRNNITNNVVNDSGYGLEIRSDNNTVQNNNIYSNSIGLRLVGSVPNQDLNNNILGIM